MNIYDIYDLDHELHRIAQENDGIIPDEKYEEFVSKRLEAKDQIEKLVHWIKEMEMFTEKCSEEMKRIKDKSDAAKTKMENIKKYMIPYVKKYGPVEAGLFKLTTRISKSVSIDTDFSDLNFMREKVVHEPDKIGIKKALEEGQFIKGARLLEKDNLQIK